MSEIWVIFGATGQQGGSVVRAILQDPILSKTISIRAAVRNPSSPAATSLQDLGCSLAQADLNSKPALLAAFQGATGIFLITSNEKGQLFYETEYQQGKNAVDAAAQSNVPKIIFSTLPSVRKATNNQLTKVVHFDVKADIEEYIRSQAPHIDGAFIALGAFMQNFTTFLCPQSVGDGTFAINTSMASSTTLPLVDVSDTGRVVVRILKKFSAYQNRTIPVFAEFKTLAECAALISKMSGKSVEYVQIPTKEFLAPLPEAVAEDWAEFGPWMAEWGYFGPGMEGMRAGGEVGGLTGFEGWLERSEVKLM